jgi:hypothetical protein
LAPQAGRDRPEWVVAINRNAWSQSPGARTRARSALALHDAAVTSVADWRTKVGPEGQQLLDDHLRRLGH